MAESCFIQWKAPGSSLQARNATSANGSILEFDDKKRSCRRRLSDHNTRRCRVQPESIQISSTWISSSSYGDPTKVAHLRKLEEANERLQLYEADLLDEGIM